MFDSITEQIIKVTKDGRYYIGDPCQVLSTVNWDRIKHCYSPILKNPKYASCSLVEFFNSVSIS